MTNKKPPLRGGGGFLFLIIKHGKTSPYMRGENKEDETEELL